MPDPILNQSFEAPLARGGVATQTWALLIDAYRELNAKKLFWITLILSVLVAAIFFLLRIDKTGVWIAGYQWPARGYNSDLIKPDQFFKLLFAGYAVPYWLGFFATVLALISVASTFPDLLTGGAVDLYLSKPISRLRLFTTKYLFGLLFAALQVAAFTFVSFLVIGIRGGAWDVKLFLAVPIVTLFFSYLFCVCTLVGVLTRSTLAAILVTVLLWAGLWIINWADEITMAFTQITAMQVEGQDRAIAATKTKIDYDNTLPVDERSRYRPLWETDLTNQQKIRADYVGTQQTAERWYRGVFIAKSVLPKTAETEQLLSRTLIDTQTRQALETTAENRARRIDEERAKNRGPNEPADDFSFAEQTEVDRRTKAQIRSRSVWWVTGTSLGFEAFVLAIAAWVFCRRDY